MLLSYCVILSLVQIGCYAGSPCSVDTLRRDMGLRPASLCSTNTLSSLHVKLLTTLLKGSSREGNRKKDFIWSKTQE